MTIIGQNTLLTRFDMCLLMDVVVVVTQIWMLWF